MAATGQQSVSESEKEYTFKIPTESAKIVIADVLHMKMMGVYGVGAVIEK